MAWRGRLRMAAERIVAGIAAAREGAWLAKMPTGLHGPLGNDRRMMVTPDEKLAELGIKLTEAKMAVPSMAVGRIVNNVLYLSGSTPPPVDGKPWKGRVGETYSVEEGYQAARACAIAQISAAKTILGDLGRVKQVVKVLGMVNCTPGFEQTPQVMHGYSDLMFEVFGEKGRHARSAVGLQALPSNVPVEIETIFEIEP
jgi:enamine deaminase RidA (YjgF/YER057c/UK114 family)